jgi:hypothetical protein
MARLSWKNRETIFPGSFWRQSRSTLRSEHQLLQSLINRKLFMQNGDVKILTAQETWDLITNVVEAAFSPPYDDEEHDGA